MIETFKNAFKIPELRAKLVFTFIILILYRFGSAVPVPFIDSAAIAELFAQQSNTIFGYLNILSGNAFSQATLFALGIQPYITASIIMQLLTVAIPALERMQKSGDDGRKKITQITRYVTVALGIITGYGYYMYCRGFGLLSNTTFFAGVVMVACYSAGSALIMWLGEKNQRKRNRQRYINDTVCKYYFDTSHYRCDKRKYYYVKGFGQRKPRGRRYT